MKVGRSFALKLAHRSRTRFFIDVLGGPGRFAFRHGRKGCARTDERQRRLALPGWKQKSVHETVHVNQRAIFPIQETADFAA